jgi:hypothetical protein
MKYLLSFLVALLILLFSACNDNENKKSEDDKLIPGSEENLNNEENESGGFNDFVEGMKNMEKMVREGGSYEALDFRKLKEFLPEELNGMKRINATGERTNTFGVDVSVTKGEFFTEDSTGRILMSITDLGSMKGFAGIAAFAWTFAKIDRETKNGFERTTTYSGNKAYEKFNTRSNEGSVEVFVADRFMVKSEGFNVPFDQIQSSVGEVNLGGLRGMKEEGKKTK